MKKIGLLIAVICVLFGLTNVSAMTESDLKAKLSQTVQLKNGSYKLSAGDKKLLDDYLNQYEVSSEHADFIAARVDKAIEIMKSEGHADFKKYSKASKEALKALVVEISNNTSVKATVTKDSVVVYKPDGSGEVFAEITGLVKQTGFGVSSLALITCISVFIVAVGSFFIVRQVKTSN